MRSTVRRRRLRADPDYWETLSALVPPAGESLFPLLVYSLGEPGVGYLCGVGFILIKRPWVESEEVYR